MQINKQVTEKNSQRYFCPKVARFFCYACLSQIGFYFKTSIYTNPYLWILVCYSHVQIMEFFGIFILKKKQSYCWFYDTFWVFVTSVSQCVSYSSVYHTWLISTSVMNAVWPGSLSIRTCVASFFTCAVRLAVHIEHVQNFV